MIQEIGFVEVIEGKESEFEAAIKVATSTVLPRAKGFKDFQLHRGIERPNVYTFTLHWETLEDHTVGFRGSELFVEWRAILGPFFVHPPVVEHWTPLWKSPNS